MDIDTLGTDSSMKKCIRAIAPPITLKSDGTIDQFPMSNRDAVVDTGLNVVDDAIAIHVNNMHPVLVIIMTRVFLKFSKERPP